MKYSVAKNVLSFETENITGEFDLQKGEILKYTSKNGKNIFTNFPSPYFWRAPTDNDFGNGMPNKLGIWKEASKNPTVVSVNLDQIVYSIRNISLS